MVSSTYDLGMSSSGHLLTRFLGKEVELVYHGMDGKAGERVKGTLEVAEPGNIVVKAEGKYIVNPNATIEAPTNAGIVTIPQLSAEVESKSGGPTDLAVTYMTGGLSWNADYTATLTPESENMNLECWATVTNKTGTDFPDAQISFVAGSPNRAVRVSRGESLAYEYRSAAKAKSDQSGFSFGQSSDYGLKAQAMGELYAYPYKSTATIQQDQMNRVRMMGSETVQVMRVYSVALPGISRDYVEFNSNPDHRISATMGINFANLEKSGLGKPMPAGAIRVYEPDKEGAVRYIGAATLGDTPKDARVSLTLTDVFDVYARARQVSAKKIDRRRTSREVEVKLSNEKSRPVELRLVQNFGNVWKVVSESSKSQKLNAWSNQWKVTIPAGGEAKLRYTVVLGG
ncbi:MAG: DUF4139 domain-containing protein [Chlorobia bacterium]|nr:DUF4139 domain-containing protein [Fimbriimonadaceae bacterium]